MNLPDPRFEGANISSAFARTIRKMARRAADDRYRNWDECILDLTLVQQGNPAFAASLSDALHGSDRAAEPTPQAAVEPDVVPAVDADANVDVPVVVPLEDSASGDAPETPSLRVSLAPFPQPGASTDHGSADVLPAPPPRPQPPLGGGRWAILAAFVLVAFALGALFNQVLGDSPAAVIEKRARAMVEDGRTDDAIESLRSAAELLSEGQARRLRRLADDLDTARDD